MIVTRMTDRDLKFAMLQILLNIYSTERKGVYYHDKIELCKYMQAFRIPYHIDEKMKVAFTHLHPISELLVDDLNLRTFCKALCLKGLSTSNLSIDDRHRLLTFAEIR